MKVSSVVICLAAILFTSSAMAAPKSAVSASGKPSTADPTLDFIRKKLKWDAQSGPEACTVREYVGAHLPLLWSNGAGDSPNNLPETYYHVLLIGRLVDKAVPIGVVEFPGGEEANASVNGQWTERNDYRTFWRFAPFPEMMVDPAGLQTPPNYIANSGFTPGNPGKDATTKAEVTSRFVKIGLPNGAINTCYAFDNACPCVSSLPQKVGG